MRLSHGDCIKVTTVRRLSSDTYRETVYEGRFLDTDNSDKWLRIRLLSAATEIVIPQADITEIVVLEERKSRTEWD